LRLARAFELAEVGQMMRGHLRAGCSRQWIHGWL